MQPFGHSLANGTAASAPLFDLRAGAPAALGASACDVASRTLPALSIGSAARVVVCGNANGATFSGVLRNPNNYGVSLYLGRGAAQCGANFNPNSFPAGTWDGSNSATTVGPLSVLAVRNLACTDSANCCVQAWCNSAVTSCSGLVASAAFVTPVAPGGACGASSQGLPAMARSNTQMRGCSGVSSGVRQSFSIANPNRNTLSIVLTDGNSSDPQGCGLDLSAPPSSYRYSQRLLNSQAQSVSWSGVACAQSSCCAVVYCNAANGDGGCYGLSFSQSFSAAAESASPLAAGILVAISACGGGALGKPLARLFFFTLSPFFTSPPQSLACSPASSPPLSRSGATTGRRRQRT